MQKQKHYVEFLFPGLVFSDTCVKEVSERDVNKVSKLMRPSTNCFGFRFFDKTVTVVDGETLTGEKKNISGWYYWGEKMTLEQVKATYGSDNNYHNLIKNMVNNGYEAVVKTESCQFIPLLWNDTVLRE